MNGLLKNIRINLYYTSTIQPPTRTHTISVSTYISRAQSGSSLVVHIALPLQEKVIIKSRELTRFAIYFFSLRAVAAASSDIMKFDFERKFHRGSRPTSTRTFARAGIKKPRDRHGNYILE